MGFPQSTRAYADISKPVAWASCDRCSFRYNHPMLQWQFDWRGGTLANLRLLVCDRCLDEPQPNGRKPIIIGPDPIPVKDPRPGFYATQNQGSVPFDPVPGQSGNFILDSGEFGILDVNTLG